MLNIFGRKQNNPQDPQMSIDQPQMSIEPPKKPDTGFISSFNRGVDRLTESPLGAPARWLTGNFGKENNPIQTMVTRPGAEIAMSGVEKLTGKKQNIPETPFTKSFFGPEPLKSYQSQTETGGRDTLISAGMTPEMADKFVPWLAVAGIGLDIVPPGVDEAVEAGAKKVLPKVAPQVAKATQAIKNFGATDDVVKQVDDIVKIAKQQQPGFEKMVKDFGKKIGKQVEVGTLKTSDRILEKIMKEEGGDVTKLMDANRSVAFVDNFTQDIGNITKQAQDYFGSNVVAVKEMNPDHLFLKNIVNIKGPNGQTAEFMVTTKPMWDAKIASGDKLYHEFRSITEDATPELLERKQQLLNNMKKLYGDAYNKTK